MQAADGIVQEGGEHEELDVIADIEPAIEHGIRAETGDEHQAERGEQIHRRRISRPRLHHHQRRVGHLAAGAIEAGMLLALPDESLDLADAGEVVVQQGVHRRGGCALHPVALVRRERVSERARREQRQRGERQQREHRLDPHKHHSHDDDLEHRDDPLLEPVDQHPLDRRNILEHAGHQVAGGAIIKPAQRQLLDVGVEVASQIEDHLLLEGVVHDDAERVEEILREKRHQAHGHEAP